MKLRAAEAAAVEGYTGIYLILQAKVSDRAREDWFEFKQIIKK